MLAAAVAAVVLADSPVAAAYETFWETDVEFAAGPLHWFDGLSLRDWVNDGAMVMFFFVVVLEIKPELVAGELRNPRAAALPVVAAVGGMVVPDLLYVAFTAGTAGAGGGDEGEQHSGEGRMDGRLVQPDPHRMSSST